MMDRTSVAPLSNSSNYGKTHRCLNRQLVQNLLHSIDY